MVPVFPQDWTTPLGKALQAEPMPYTTMPQQMNPYMENYTIGMRQSTLEASVPPAGMVPIDAEWTTLTDNLGGLSVAGGKMKSTGTTYWFFQSAGTDNSSGFTALPGSNRACFGPFNTVVGVYAFFWSATENGLSPGTATST